MLSWLNIPKTEQVLYVGAPDDRVPQSLLNENLKLFCAPASELEIKSEKESGIYSAIIAVFAIEKETDPVGFLKVIKKLLKPDGRLILGCENRLAIRYFCGDRDPYTGRSFDGIEDYRRTTVKKSDELSGRCYDRARLEEVLDAAGFTERKFYSCMPYADSPSLVFSEDYLPNEELSIRYFPIYHYPDSVFLEEEYLYTGLIKNGLFHKLANNYIIECGPKDRLSDVLHVTSSYERSPEDALYTIIHEDGTVEKKPIYPEGEKRTKDIDANLASLGNRGIQTIKGKLVDGAYVMPFVEYKGANGYLQELFFKDRDAFIREMDSFRDLILSSSEHIDPPGDWFTDGRIRKSSLRWTETPQEAKRRESGVSTDEMVAPDIKEAGIWLKTGYFDLVPLNAFHTGDGYVIYDQEFAIDTYPANAIITRMVENTYRGNLAMNRDLPMQFFYDRYGLTPQITRWRKYSGHFLAELRNERELKSFHEKYRVDSTIVNVNRQRMNYSADEYQKLFVNIFDGTEGKDLYLFGSGRFTSRFLERFGSCYKVENILDNDSSRHGMTVGDIVDGNGELISLSERDRAIKIVSPDTLLNKKPGTYKVIICIKNYLSVMKQLKQMGINNFSIYDPYADYPDYVSGRRVEGAEASSGEKKPYNIGYVAGVFDLFHMGHLNILRRAKEQCNYLIVGIVSDEGVRRNKKTEPMVKFEDRKAIVEACRYVDEAVEIPLSDGSSKEAHRRYHFDAQFSGSDYENDPSWLGTKTYLEKHGAELVFFPYTESVSTTQLKVEIRERSGSNND